MAKSPRSQFVGLENGLFPAAKAIPPQCLLMAPRVHRGHWGQHIFVFPTTAALSHL